MIFNFYNANKKACENKQRSVKTENSDTFVQHSVKSELKQRTSSKIL